MARILTTGWETNALEGWDTGTIDTVDVRKSSAGNGGSRSLKLVFPEVSTYNLSSSHTEAYFRFGGKFSGFYDVGSGAIFFRLFIASGPTLMVRLRVRDTGSGNQIRLDAGLSLSEVANSGANVLAIGQFYRIEMYVKIAVAGQITIRVNGTTWIDYSGDTTRGGAVNFNQMRLDYTTTDGSGTFYDDFAMNDITGTRNNSWAGQGFIQVFSPNAVGNSSQWTPTSGANYTTVDEFPTADDLDYVETGTVGFLDLYGLPNLPSDAQGAKVVEVKARAQRSGTTIQNANLAIRVGSTNYFSGNKPLGNGVYGTVENAWEEDPSTNEVWGVAAVNGMEAGIKAAA